MIKMEALLVGLAGVVLTFISSLIGVLFIQRRQVKNDAASAKANQAKADAEREKIKNEITDTILERAYHEIEELHKLLDQQAIEHTADIAKIKERAEADNAELRRSLKDYAVTTENLRQQVVTLIGQLSDKDRIIDEMRLQIERMRATIIELKADNTDLRADNAELHQEIDRLRANHNQEASP
jgi:DNA recombination-dependent growth factor C